MENQVTIPSDVIMEIFSRLPARSVGRFRTLSKQYHTLLSQPLFIMEHLIHGGTNSSVKLLVNMIELNYRKTWLIYYPFSSFDKYLTLHGSEVKYSSYQTPTGVSLLCSCNGIFCVQDGNDRIMLWNPTTREIYCLPQLHDTILDNYGEVNYDYGFGYDSLNDDYKFVFIMWVSNEERSFLKIPSKTKTYIYSHRSRCWKEIQAFPCYTIYGNSHFVHNKVHWVPYLSSEDGVFSQVIVSLDLATERYGTIRQPKYHGRAPGVFSRRYGTDQVDLCVLGGELCVNVNYQYESDFQLWVMKEYGVEKSWCHVLSISVPNLVFSINQGKAICEPLFLMKSGEILVRAIQDISVSIYLYNPKTCSFITVHDGRHNGACLSGHVYVETLVQLNLT